MLIYQKLKEYLGVTDDDIIWFNYTFDFIYEEYMVIYEYIEPVYKAKVKGHCIIKEREISRILKS
jgi:hypothetical protein